MIISFALVGAACVFALDWPWLRGESGKRERVIYGILLAALVIFACFALADTPGDGVGVIEAMHRLIGSVFGWSLKNLH